ncbi:MAG: hypothetical protein ACTSYA_13285 [Candidatus Kariarchaeaceae archaeon]
MTSLQPRVDKLEEYMTNLNIVIIKLSNEMSDFKNEMKDFKDEMSDFKDEMKDFKDESKVSRDEMNVRWGNLANSLGRVVEDLIIPNIDIIIEKCFEEKIQDYYGSLYKRNPITNEGREFDGIITTKSNIFLFEIKSKITQEHALKMREFICSGDFFKYFPNYKGKKLIPVMGSLNLKDHQVKMLTEEKILALAIRGDILTFKNLDELKL